MYGLITMAMNHSQSLRILYGGKPFSFVPDCEEPYSRDFGDETDKRKVAQQILLDLDLGGRFRVNGNLDRRLAIIRLDPMSPTRVLYFPAEQRIEVAVQQLRKPNMLARLHMRQGFRTEYVADELPTSADERTGCPPHCIPAPSRHGQN